MRGTKDHNSPAASGAPHATVAAGSYYELAIAHVRANGRLDADGARLGVVKERDTPAQWRAWLAYFAHLDGQTWPRGKKAQTFRSVRNGATVPTAWPVEFDLSAPPTPPLEPEAPVSAARRKELAAMLRALVANIAPPAARAPTWRDMTPTAAEARLDDLRDKFASDPPHVNTAEFAAYLAGMREQKGGDAELSDSL